MPDTRRHRGRHPEDDRLFSGESQAILRTAAAELSWLLSRAYAHDSALKLVGDRHSLTARQRDGVRRCVCTQRQRNGRQARQVPLTQCAGCDIGIDGYNVLITVEAALSGGVVLVGMDGAYRDLSGVHGTYRKVEETIRALSLIADSLEHAGVGRIDWYLDRPVSNSGRLKAFMADVLEKRGGALQWNIELVDNPDNVLSQYRGVVGSSDSALLDTCDRWVNLSGAIIGAHVKSAWIVDLSSATD